MKKIAAQVNDSKVYNIVNKTNLDSAKLLSQKLNNAIFLKREDQQKLNSFKLRGAFHKVNQLTKNELNKGIITVSAGNHAQGVAYCAKTLEISCTIVMPLNTPDIKVNAVKNLGAKVILQGDNYNQAYDFMIVLAKEKDMNYIPAFDDIAVIIGQATIAKEIVEQLQNIDYIFVPVGGGGLISGIGLYLKEVSPNTKIIGVEPKSSAALFESLKQKKLVILQDVGIFSEGVAVSHIGKLPFEITKEIVDEVILVNDDEICGAIKEVFEDTRSIVETSGALSVAGCKKYIQKYQLEDKNCVAILSGANVNFDKLRFIAERAELGEQKEAIFSVKITEEMGSFYQFCNILGSRQITEFNYRFSDKKEALVFVGIALKDKEEKLQIIEKFKENKYSFADLSSNELAKTHIRYMVGGKADIKSEKLYRFTFPEKIGALSEFLARISKYWNISLFHYRNYGASFGEVLVGIETNNEDSLEKILNELNYPYVDESNNNAYHFFL
jgi:threonine dehydratase